MPTDELKSTDESRTVIVRITDQNGTLLACFQASDPILSAEEIAVYMEDEAHDLFDAEAL